MEKVPMTAEGYSALEAELRSLKTEERPAVIAAIAEARSHGDLSENAEYHAAKERQSFIEGRIAELEDKMARAQVIDVKRLSGSTIKFGATVTVVDEDTDEEAAYKIVGEDEADVRSGKISITSPIARALIGKEVGDVVGPPLQPARPAVGRPMGVVIRGSRLRGRWPLGRRFRRWILEDKRLPVALDFDPLGAAADPGTAVPKMIGRWDLPASIAPDKLIFPTVPVPGASLPDCPGFAVFWVAAFVRFLPGRQRSIDDARRQEIFVFRLWRADSRAHEIRLRIAIGLPQQEIEEDAQHLDDLARFGGLDRGGTWLEIPASHLTQQLAGTE
jgi:transcription elongation factor GreA